MGMDQQFNACADSSEKLSNEKLFRALVDLAGDGTMVSNRQGIVLDVNAAMCNLLGLARDQIVGRHITKLPFSPDSLVKNPFRFDNLENGNTVVAECEILRPNASPVTVEMRARMVPNGSVHCISRDITVRKYEEYALRASEERYRQLFELESDAIFLIDNEVGQILETNTAATSLYGFSRDELVSMRNVDLSAEPEETQRATLGAPKVTAGIIYIPIRYHRKADGSVFPIEITARAFMHAGRSVHIAAIRDITERKRVEDELRKREEHLRELTSTLENRVLERTHQLKAANASLMQTVRQLRKLSVDLSKAEEGERKRLALLLHDHLQPFLAAATLKVSMLSEPMPTEERTLMVQAALDLIQDAINASRALTMELYPSVKE